MVSSLLCHPNCPHISVCLASGRPPNNEEKSSVKDKFVQHKQANDNATKATAEVERIRAEITQIEEHLRVLKETPPIAPLPTVAAVIAAVGTDTVSITSQELTQLTEQLHHLQTEYQSLQEAYQITQKEFSNLQIDNKDLTTRLENIRHEKRTDLVARLEIEVEEFRLKVSETMSEMIALKTDITKRDTKIKELNERVLVAENELKERDEREIQKVSHDQEAVALKTQVSKQRNEIVMKSKAATAGWDAAANAEEKLDVEMERAYHRGVSEGKRVTMQDLQSVHEAIEAKEQKIVELIEKNADSEKRMMIAEKEMEEAQQQLLTANHYVEMMKAQLESKGSDGGGGMAMMMMSSPGNDEKITELEDELEKSKERLDETQEEMVSLTEQVDELQTALQFSEQKIKLLQQMVATAASSTAAGSGGGNASPSLSGSSSRQDMKGGLGDTGRFVDDTIGHIRTTIEKVFLVLLSCLLSI
jgi:chromosome segregation ATPase